jgi:hypothetical protein
MKTEKDNSRPRHSTRARHFRALPTGASARSPPHTPACLAPHLPSSDIPVLPDQKSQSTHSCRPLSPPATAPAPPTLAWQNSSVPRPPPEAAACTR